jgi:hypothetical protein
MLFEAGGSELFIEGENLSPEVTRHLEASGVSVYPYENFTSRLETLTVCVCVCACFFVICY